MSTGQGERPLFLDAGEAALVVEFGRSVDPAISDRVLALDAALAADPPEGLRELVPTYRSLMIHYDPLRLERARLVALVEERLTAPVASKRAAAHWTVPCCYDLPHGEDLAEMAALLGLSATEAAAIHASASYRVYMYGFSPGFTYLGGLPEAIAISRRIKPRPPHDSKVVLVGGGLSAIASFSMPTGWYVVGRTPERLYAPERAEAFLFEPGDSLRFEPIDASTFMALDARAEAGEVVARRQAP
ncbi:MAG TPA: allophanate hydrolase subunit 1 [Bosea sp. (in: a-proteobacteria)]|jgi:KipI family sensor histidine kinase inhibitor|uniref:5-oxoprolinase subunit B family protein n=1 Tax=Bosea sp. (in: a-proteobacteria) TaxID=1871050 RepID=UPI002E14EA22|nr:allophanate hydrolase subunit 1 [Bosea sp. (in: a-proteobacteria)]